MAQAWPLTAVRLFLCLCAVFVLLPNTNPFVDGQIIDQACQGYVGGYFYDLANLSIATGGSDQTAVDVNQNTYYYRPCQPLTVVACQENGDMTPGGCQRDTRRPPQYHDLGSAKSAEFSQLPDADADQGFLLTFSGGSDDRRVDIAFYCDETAGTGSLATLNPAENPMHSFHLTWRSALACPAQNGTNTTTGGLECCLYDYSTNQEDTKALCLDNSDGNQQCPQNLGAYELIGQWPVDECADCFFRANAILAASGADAAKTGRHKVPIN